MIVGVLYDFRSRLKDRVFLAHELQFFFVIWKIQTISIFLGSRPLLATCTQSSKRKHKKIIQKLSILRYSKVKYFKWVVLRKK